MIIAPSDTPTPTATATHDPNATATKTRTRTATHDPNATATKTRTPTTTHDPNATATKTRTATATHDPNATATKTPTPTATATNTPTVTRTATPTGTLIATPTATVTRTPNLTVTPTPTMGSSQAIIIDHTNTDITLIPSEWIETAKQKIAWIFVHTSHGSQLVTGAQYLSPYVNPPLYNFINRDGEAPYDFFIPTQVSPIALRMGNNSNWGYSAPDFTAMIQQHITSANYGPTDIPVFMYAFCGEVDYMTPGEVQQYLDGMAWGESTYPDVTFVYITDHADNGADQDVLNANANMIRDYVNTHNKILYDFNDIDKYQPDGTLPPGIPDDSCPWCQSWCDNHPGFCPDFSLMGDCAHSHKLNCLLKSRAMWWLSARLAGWDGQTK
jgi:hypothetical protein